MRRLCILTLGGFEARLSLRSDTPIRFRTRKAAALTAFLALQRNCRASRDAIAELLWTGVPQAQARHSLRQTILDIRQTLNAADDHLGDHLLATTSDDVALTTSRVFIDVRTFRRCVERQTARSLSVACSLYRGEFLAGLYTRESSFDQWIANQRNRLHMMALDAHERHIDLLVQRERVAAALDTALRVLELDPFHERAHRVVMMLYARRGDISAVKRQYDALVSLLRDELNIDPAPETRELVQSILRDRGPHFKIGGSTHSFVATLMAAVMLARMSC
jgi:DNA-binding SARP family transcriptional activator